MPRINVNYPTLQDITTLIGSDEYILYNTGDAMFFWKKGISVRKLPNGTYSLYAMGDIFFDDDSVPTP
jgi:hypothetical protein